MALLLLIETSTTVCSAALARDGEVISSRETNDGYAHAERLTLFCEAVLKEANVSFGELQGVAVSRGPGSYTGLRIGLSAAKGFCYALDIPLMTVDTLKTMAAGMREDAREGVLCPLIDARRMEVYCAVYDLALNEKEAARAEVVDENSFRALLDNNVVLFSGDGMPKCRELLGKHPNARFTEAGIPSAKHLAALAEKMFAENQFEDLAYSEPFYLKAYIAGKKPSA